MIRGPGTAKIQGIISITEIGCYPLYIQGNFISEDKISDKLQNDGE